jgi:poly-gamma-glutamate synthesis protein (capsule biosynthesis protein)
VSSTVSPGTHAGAATAEVPGRPGVAPLRIESRYVVPEEWHERLTELSEGLGLEAIKQWRSEAGIPAPDDGFTLLNADALAFTNASEFHLEFEVGDEFAIERRPNPADVDALVTQIQQATRQADWVLVSLHSHEGRGARINDSSVPGFLTDVAHKSIDVGADAVLGHGAHTLRGIEIYDQAPIFYGLGNFAAQIETVERLPASMYTALGLDPREDSAADVYDRLDIHEDEEYWESVLPLCHFTEDGIEQITLTPLDLGHERSRGSRGTPFTASPKHGEQILQRLADHSSSFGTRITIEDGEGRIQL